MAVGSVPTESVQQPGREAGLAGERGRVGESFLLCAGLVARSRRTWARTVAESSSRVVKRPRGTARAAQGVSAVKVAVWPAPSSSATLSRAQGPAHVPNRMTRPAAVVADADAVPSSRTSRWSAGAPWLRRVSPGAWWRGTEVSHRRRRSSSGSVANSGTPCSRRQSGADMTAPLLAVSADTDLCGGLSPTSVASDCCPGKGTLCLSWNSPSRPRPNALPLDPLTARRSAVCMPRGSCSPRGRGRTTTGRCCCSRWGGRNWRRFWRRTRTTGSRQESRSARFVSGRR